MVCMASLCSILVVRYAFHYQPPLEETVRQCDRGTLDRLHALIEARRAADRGSQQEP